MDTLTTLSKIREKRLEDARIRVLMAHQAIERKQTEVQEAQNTLDDYAKKLPELIEQLYLEVIGQKVDVAFVQEKTKMETKLVQKKTEYQQQVNQRQDELAQAQQDLITAQIEYAHQEKKKEGMKILLHEQNQRQKRAEEQQLNKIIDELASVQYFNKTKSC